MDPFQITQLADLMKPEDVDSESDDDMMPKSSYSKMGPGDLAPKKKSVTSDSNSGQKKKENDKDIWGENEVADGEEYDDTIDPRPQPEYDILYKQAVTSEDMYLQMGNKSPATASCEDMVVKIKLPNTKLADVELDVKPKFLDCRTPKYKLGLHLPNPVDDQTGKAQWDGKTETLSVTMKMKREYDFMNF